MIKKIFLCVVLVAVMSGQLFPLFLGNQVNCLIVPCNSPISGPKTQSVTPENNIEMAAFYFFKSEAAFREYLAGAEIRELQPVQLSKAVESLADANKLYIKLLNEFASSEYLPSVIEKLNTFDYDAFMQKEALNADIFNKVKFYLKNGNVKGIMTVFVEDSNCLLTLLQDHKKNIENNPLSAPELWRINQKYMEFLLFGQYVTQVIQNISE